MSAHDPCGPSTLRRRAACPGSLAAELPLWDTPEDPDVEADRGTHRHGVAARGLTDPASRIAGLAALADEDDRALVQSWWNFWACHMAAGPGEVIGAGVEDAVALIGDRKGTCDAWMYTRSGSDRRLTVADLKGQPIPARGNLQLIDYAAGILGRYALTPGELVVELVIVSRAGVDSHEMTRDELRAEADRIQAVIAAARAEGAPRSPGAHCTYCRARDVCTTRIQSAAQVVVYSGLMADPVGTLMSLAPDDRTALMDRLTVAAERLEEAASAIKGAIRDGKAEVPGYRAVPSTRQEWKDPANARAALLAAAEARGLSPEDLTPLVGVSKAAQLLGKDAVEPLTERKPATPSVRRMKGAA